MGIIHRDVKPANILIGNKAGKAKISDYGTSRVATIENTMTVIGTIVYQAPEITRNERYGFAADVYSFALTAYAVCDQVGLFVLLYFFLSASFCNLLRSASSSC